MLGRKKLMSYSVNEAATASSVNQQVIVRTLLAMHPGDMLSALNSTAKPESNLYMLDPWAG
jgi:hypothetical protein